MATTPTATSSKTLTSSLPRALTTTRLISLLAPPTFLPPLLPVSRTPMVALAQLLAAEAQGWLPSMLAHPTES
jgi:hypothetical protein